MGNPARFVPCARRAASFDRSSRRTPVQHLPHNSYHFRLFHSERIGPQSRRLETPESKTANSFDHHTDTGKRLHESLVRLVRGPAVCGDKIISHDVFHGHVPKNHLS